jgi:hypothetical protein
MKTFAFPFRPTQKKISVPILQQTRVIFSPLGHSCLESSILFPVSWSFLEPLRGIVFGPTPKDRS